MKKLFQIGLILAAACQFATAQQQELILNGEIEMGGGTAVNPIYIVVGNSATTGVVTNSGGFIYSESEFNMLLWNIGTNTGTYLVPFGYSSSLYLPLTLNINSAGIGSGEIKFSTYHTIADNLSGVIPSDVTNLNAFVLPGSPSNADDSYKIADRFFIIDANTGYTTKPAPGNITFSYIHSGALPEASAPNGITESHLMAERFNSGSSIWSDWFGEGCTDAILGNIATVQTGPVPAADLYRSWALWDNNGALPLKTNVVNVLCNGGNGSGTVTAYAGSTPYTYLWTPGSNTNQTPNLSAGNYTITVTDANGCSASSSAVITQPNALSVSTNVTSEANCGGNTGSASSTVSGGTTPYTYSWTGGGTNSTVSGLSAGTYTLNVTDNNGCTASASASITQTTSLSISASTTANIKCNGDVDGAVTSSVITGGTPPFTYSWTGGGSTASISNLSVGSYTVTIHDINGCSGTASTAITQPAVLTASANVTSNANCGGNTGSLSSTVGGGTTPYTYSWTGGGSNSTVSALSAGTYTLSVTDNNGCTASASATITQSIAISVSASTTMNAKCNGDFDGAVTSSVTSGGTAPFTYSWTGGGTTAAVSALSAGTYTVTIHDVNGCSGTASTIITQPLALSIIQGDKPATVGSCNGSAWVTTSGGTSPYTYLWSPAGETTDTIKNKCVGNYCCKVTDNNGCVDSDCVNITTGIQNITDASSIKIYPDPNNGQFTIAGVVQGQVIEVYNYLGQILISTVVDKATMQFDISNKTNGVYLIRIENKDGRLVTQRKIVKTQ